MKRIIFLILVLLGIKDAHAGTHVVIKGTIHTLDKEISILVSPVVGGFSNPFLQDEKRTAANGSFEIVLPQDRAGYIMLECKYFRLTLYVVPADTILIDCDSSRRVRIEGGLSAVNELLNTGRFTNGPSLNEQIHEVLFNEAPAQDKVKSLLSVLNKYRYPVDSLASAATIDTAVISSLAHYKQGTFLFLAFNSLVGSYDKLRRGEYVANLDAASIKEIATALFNELRPFDEAQPSVPPLVVALVNVCMAMDRKLIPGVMYNEQDWLEKDGVKSYYSYTPVKLQEELLSHCIIIARKLGTRPVSANIATFKRLFPESPYNTVFAGWVGGSNAVSTVQDSVLTYRSANDTITAANTASYGSISSFIKTYFKGKPVLVDCWATWCSPCKAEFKFEPALRAFLKEHGVEMLYVSMDANTNGTTWRSSIREFQLEGTHICASEALLNNTAALLGVKVMAVPRYLIYDGSGHLLEQDALRPSSGTALYNQISHMLGMDKTTQP